MSNYHVPPQHGANDSTGRISLITGSATLTGGTVTVADANIRAGAHCFITREVDGGSIGSYKGVVTAGQVVLTSTSGTDTSTLNYLIVNPSS